MTLLPAAFGILVLQKAGGVVKASVTPRLLPPGLTLVTANARAGLISIITSTAAAGLAAGVQYTAGAAWTLRVGTVIYLVSMFIALRLPEQIDLPARDAGDVAGPQRAASPPARTCPDRRGRRPPTRRARCHWRRAGLPDGGEAGKGRRRHWRTLPEVGPVVGEAMAVNAVLRAFSGYILFLLAFLLRSVDLGTVFHHPVSHNFALGALALGLSAGSLASMVLGSFFRSRGPQLIMFTVLIIAPVVTAVCAWGFGLWAAVGVEFTAIFCASLAKLGPGLDRRPRDRRRDQVLDVLRLRDAQPGRQRGRRPRWSGRVHTRQRAGGAGDRGRRPRRRGGPARRAPQAARPAPRADVPAPGRARRARREPVRARCPWRPPSAGSEICLASFGSGCLPRR